MSRLPGHGFWGSLFLDRLSCLPCWHCIHTLRVRGIVTVLVYVIGGSFSIIYRTLTEAHPDPWLAYTLPKLLRVPPNKRWLSHSCSLSKILFSCWKKCLSVCIDRLGDVTWKLCVTDTSGKEHWLPADSSKLFASSLCIRWYSIQLPPFTRLKVLQVFAFLPVFYHRNWTPNENR